MMRFSGGDTRRVEGDAKQQGRHASFAAMVLAMFWAVFWVVFWALGILFPFPSLGWAKDPPLNLERFQLQVDDLLEWNGLDREYLSLLLYSVKHGLYLYQHNIRQPMIAASNTKLVTTYAALKVLSPDFRWRTRFYMADENHDGVVPPRQGLLVKGSGDPTLKPADLDRAALYMKSAGLRRLEGGIYFDGSIFDEVMFPATWGDVSKGEPWFAPVSPFIVSNNTVEFMIAKRPGLPFFDVLTAAPGFQVISSLKENDQIKPSVRVTQDWQGDGATFFFSGSLAPAKDPYRISAAVERPRVHFYRRLTASLRRAGIEGEMPLRLGSPTPGNKRQIYQIISPPLREVIVEVNKNSNNLAAEVLLRTMGLQERKERVSADNGLALVRRLMEREFEQTKSGFTMIDGSGLSRENRMSALLLVRLLNRVRHDFSIRPEFINSLPLALTDGTLQYRHFPWRLRGRLRAKSGSLAGVSNLTGFLELERDLVLFSFLINEPGRPHQELQEAQDLVMGGLFDFLQALEAGEPTE